MKRPRRKPRVAHIYLQLLHQPRNNRVRGQHDSRSSKPQSPVLAWTSSSTNGRTPPKRDERRLDLLMGKNIWCALHCENCRSATSPLTEWHSICRDGHVIFLLPDGHEDTEKYYRMSTDNVLEIQESKNSVKVKKSAETILRLAFPSVSVCLGSRVNDERATKQSIFHCAIVSESRTTEL